MIFDPQTTVAFTGHRTYRGECDMQLAAAVERLYNAGKRVFLSGMAVGFDLAAAEKVLEFKAAHPDVRLVAVVPFEGQELRFPVAERRRFEAIVAAADEAVLLSGAFHRGCYAVRNNYLVDNSSVVVAWYDCLTDGGTRYTFRRALKSEREVWNLHALAPVRIYTPTVKLF